jgi:sarcosine oxidase subunit alpha
VVGRVTQDTVEFTWDGDPVEGREGEPIACALWRTGVRTQTRSIKFHRARGPQCFAGDCPGCLVRVDGVPNVRGCRRRVEDGLEVASQVGRPTAEHDLLSAIDRVFEHFDHERRFVRPRIVREVYETVARRLAGFGDPPTGDLDVAEGGHRSPDVLVAGGGPAGLAAARAAREAGRDVLAVDEDGFGGRLTYTPREVEAGELGPAPGPALADELAPPGEERVDGSVVGLYDAAALVAEATPEGLAVHRVDADAVVLANGAAENPVLVDGNDRPGVLGARAARILMNRWDVDPGEPVAVVDPGREGRAFAREARERGLTVHQLDEATRILGDPAVTAVETPEDRVPAGACVLDAGLTPAPELGRQAGVPYTYEAPLGGRVPRHDPDGATPVPGVHVAGSCAGLHPPEAALRQGRRAGRRAAGEDVEADPEPLLEAPGLDEGVREALTRVWRQA